MDTLILCFSLVASFAIDIQIKPSNQTTSVLWSGPVKLTTICLGICMTQEQTLVGGTWNGKRFKQNIVLS
jgi:hypothetical protein